ncbi:hypothetical protein ACS0TY_032781 [Phlomoides rotata]
MEQLYPSHHSTWKRAGIFDAITASKCIIPRLNHLILELVEKWCPKTNSFVFPWGEASITLEDIMVLGGYPVLGEPVLIPPENEEMEETVDKLETARREIGNRSKTAGDLGKWIAQFKGSGDESEHAALLVYWLSRFVFPSSGKTLCRRVIPIAVRLARGTQIALAPTLLATVYKSLTILKAAIILARKSEKTEAFLQVAVPAPLAFVQVWIWERFPSLRPKLGSVGQSGPRLARWDRLKLGSEYKSMSIESSSIGKDFQWRPYTTTECSGFVYMENEGWEMVDSDLGEDLKGFVRCLRWSELVSLDGDSMEQYLPHRVAMQFGMDQDIPGDVERVNVSWEIAWKHYTRPIIDTKLYVPARLSEPHVTSRYLAWWKTDVVGGEANGDSGYNKGWEQYHDLFGRKSEADILSSPPPGFSLAWKKVQKGMGIQRKRALCASTVNNGGKSCSKGLKIKLKFVGSSSSGRGGKRSDSPKSVKRGVKSVENSSSGKRLDGKSSKRCRKLVEILSRGKSGDNSSNGEKGSSKIVEILSGGKSGDNSSNGEMGSSRKQRKVMLNVSEPQCQEETNHSDEGTESPRTGFEERIRIAEKLVAFLEAGKLVCL